MPHRIVDVLEAVDVHHRQGKRRAVAALLIDGDGNPVIQQNPVRQPGQRIVQGDMPDILVSAFLLGNIVGNAEKPMNFVTRTAQCRDG